MFWLLIAILCLGLLNWQLVVLALLVTLVVTTPVLAAIVASLCFIAYSVYMLNNIEGIETHYVGEIVLAATVDTLVCECEIIAIDKTSPFKYHVKRRGDGYLFCVKSVIKIEEDL
jgi:hypothetical protein